MSAPRAAALPAAEQVIWHDVECGGYEADLDCWRELTRDGGGPLLDLGAGTGRVALDLAAAGRAVTALDREPALLDALAQRARERNLELTTECADACSFELGRRFGTVLAPMQLLQILGGPERRAAALACARSHLEPGGLFATAIAPLGDFIIPEGGAEPLPDVRELDGWVFSSSPVEFRSTDAEVVIERRREIVAPGGELTRSIDRVALERLETDELITEAERHRLRALPPRSIAATDAHVGSTVVVLEAC